METFRIQKEKTLYEKLSILSDAAKYDVACTSSGIKRSGDGTGIGNCEQAGICHSFTPDGRCVSLLKILFTNECILTASTVSTVCPMMWRGRPLLRMRSAVW